jgi:hypothetical protein
VAGDCGFVADDVLTAVLVVALVQLPKYLTLTVAVVVVAGEFALLGSAFYDFATHDLATDDRATDNRTADGFVIHGE